MSRRQTDDYYVMLLGETGSGKSTLLNMLVNFYRGPPGSRVSMPDATQLKLAVPTKFLKATEKEGMHSSERNANDRESCAAWNVALSCYCRVYCRVYHTTTFICTT